MIANAVKGFPSFRKQIDDLVDAHRELPDETLLLAIYYAPDRQPPREQDIFLFEVIQNFGVNHIDPDRHIFEVEGGSTPDFRMDQDQRLHLVLTNPEEFGVALRQRWSAIEELREAIKRGSFDVVYSEPEGEQFLESLRE